MKEWLKVFVFALTGEHLDYTIDQYLRNHPLPLPTDEEIGGEAMKRRTTNTGYQYTHDIKWFVKGAKWMRDQIRKEEK